MGTAPAAKLPPALKVNLTHLGQLMNTTESSAIPDLLKGIETDHVKFAQALMDDETKTDTMKQLMVRQDANKKLITNVIPVIDKERDNADGQIKQIEKMVDDKFVIQGTTDALLLMSQAQVLQGFKFGDVTAMIEEGDTETLRAMQLPVMKHHFRLNKDDGLRQSMINRYKETALLEPEQLTLLTKSREISKVLHATGDGLVNQVATNAKTIQQIQSTIVEHSNE